MFNYVQYISWPLKGFLKNNKKKAGPKEILGIETAPFLSYPKIHTYIVSLSPSLPLTRSLSP